MNKHLDILIVAPITTSQKNYPSGLRTNFKGKQGESCFDHLDRIHKSRIVQIGGTLDPNLRKPANELLRTMFSEL
jgi:mRNA interferase MazF